MLRRSAYDQWIAELCRDAEESALERDRLKAKLEGLREDHKRKVMAKILGRLGNMQYFVAWSAWYNATVKMHQMEVEAKIRELKKELKEYTTKTAEIEEEAQRRADEAAKMSLGAASESQRKLILKIMTKLTQGLARLGWNQWAKQAFGHKMQQQKMKKIIKRLYNAQLNKGFIAWKTITQKWNLFAKLELKDKLIAELADLEAKAIEYKADAEKRQEDAAAAALARATGAQKDLLIKIMSKMCGNYMMMGWSVWKLQAVTFKRNQALLSKILMRLVRIKEHTAFKHWHVVVFKMIADKHKLREALLENQRDNLNKTLVERAQQLKALQREAMELLHMSQQNAAETAGVMMTSDAFADHLHLILDKKALDKKNAPSYEAMLHSMGEGGAPDPARTQQPPARARGDARLRDAPARPGARDARRQPAAKPAAAPKPTPTYAPPPSKPAAPKPAAAGFSPPPPTFSPPPQATGPRPTGSRLSGGEQDDPEPKMSDEAQKAADIRAELLVFLYELEKAGHITLPEEGAGATPLRGGLNSPVQRQIRGRENWEAPSDSFLVPELEKLINDDLGGVPGPGQVGNESLRSRGERVLKPLALKGDSRLYAAKKAYEASGNLDDLWGTLEILQALPPARVVS
ncbi:mannosyl-oligosaccharide 1,2-alpha-mannosidase [Aureococcus anophagefferens]|nr:mannosyl-oligosaccharide 1,2-alpha-mannosidase [Aureococcus anophagefferens]